MNDGTVKQFYARLASVIDRENSMWQRKAQLLALWEARSATSKNTRAVELGNGIAANLRGTPADCIRGQSLMNDLDWQLSRLEGGR